MSKILNKKSFRGVIISGIIFFLCFNFSFAQVAVNKFSDPVIRDIHDLADKRDSISLLKYLKDNNPNYQGEALMCFASIQAPSLNDSIAPLLDSEMNGIRMVAAFALGQSYHQGAVKHIRSALEKDTVKLVRGMLFDALGKTGDNSDLKWLASQKTDYQEAEGQAQGILRFALRGIITKEGNDRMLKIINEGTSTVGLIYATYHIGRYADSLWLKANIEELEKLYRNESDPVLSANLISGIIKGRGDDAATAIEIVLKSDLDYREKVNTLMGINHITWAEVSKIVFDISESGDPNLSVAASEAIVRNAKINDLKKIRKNINGTQNWRSRALLLSKAMDLSSESKDQLEIEKIIIEYFQVSQNDSEKGWLLKCFSSRPDKFMFLAEQLKSPKAVIRTNAMEALTGMVRHSNYQKEKEILALKGQDLDQEFLEIFKASIASGDIALVSMAAGIFRDNSLPYKEKIKDLSFLENALQQAHSPELVEARNELISTLAYLSGKSTAEYEFKSSYNHPINWDRVVNIPPRQLVGIATSKGDVIVQLNVNWCPGTVAAFVELAESGFYDGKAIHRVVPNFVVQDGCPRGDGWGGPPFTIRSEFTPAPFLEGTLGMASAGKDTEGSQWYFTHTATLHLDGKYSNFGKVVEGIEVVHQLEVGDVIKKMVVISDDGK